MATKTVNWDFELHYSRKVAPLLPEAPWVFRITDLSGKPSPVFVMKQRRTVPLEPSRNGRSKKSKKTNQTVGSLFEDSPPEKVIRLKYTPESSPSSTRQWSAQSAL